jgi:hypothetical protein
VAPWLKIERANSHLEDFNASFSAWTATNPYELVVDSDSQGTEQIVKIRRQSPLPEALINIAADAIHNFYAALDQATFVLATEIAGCTDTNALREVYFPIGADKSAFQKRISRGLARGYFTHDIADFFCEIEPYLGGRGASLYALHRLDLADKHRSVIDLHSADVLRVNHLRSGRWFHVNGEEVEIGRHSKQTNLEYNPKVLYRLFFNDVEGVPRQSLQMMGVYRELVTRVVHGAEARFFPVIADQQAAPFRA